MKMVIELRTYFAAKLRPGKNDWVYPMTIVSDEEPMFGLPKLSFAGNSFRLQAGNSVWVNQFVPKGRPNFPGQVLLTSFVENDGQQRFFELSSIGISLARLESGITTSVEDESVEFNIDPRPGTFWNTTGTPIPAFDVLPVDKAPIMKMHSIGSFRSSRTGVGFSFMIDSASANPNAMSQVDVTTPALRAELEKQSADIQKKERGERSSQSGRTPANDFLPPTNPPGASPKLALFGASSFNPCQQVLKTADGVTLNLTSFYAEESAEGVAVGMLRAEAAEWLLLVGPPAVCTAQAIVVAMASKSGSIGGNQQENKQASDARNEAERKTGKRFTPALQRKFHDEITGHGYSYQELVDIAIDVLQGRT